MNTGRYANRGARKTQWWNPPAKSVLGLLIIGLAVDTVKANDAATSQLPTSCIQQKATFDGANPLTYATVSTDTGAKLFLHREYPGDCVGAHSCKNGAYIVPGDTVAIAKTCGDWSFIQFIGESRISAGWAERSRLTPLDHLAPTSAASDSNPFFQYRFSLTKGRGSPVCEAYLQRLSQTEFRHQAYCDRPESDVVPGFGKLNRENLSIPEMNRIVPQFQIIRYIRSNLSADMIVAMNRSGGVYGGGLPPPGTGILRESLPPRSSWRYSPLVDIDNDGTPDHVWIYSEESQTLNDCLTYAGNNAVEVRAEHIALVVTPDESTIDQRKTIAIFGHPDGGYRVPTQFVQSAGFPPFMKSFRIIGGSYGIFEYRGLYYFDTFFDGDADEGDFEDRRKSDRGLEDTLGVFLRQRGTTRQVCEYHAATSTFP